VIVDDVTAPAVPTLANITGECSATATAPTTTDNCSGTITGTTTDPTTYSAQGTYTITWTFDDGNGNTSTATQTVIVDDVTAPLVQCQNATIYLNTSGVATLLVSQVNNGTTDNCGIPILSVSQNAFSAVGQYNVVLTAIDLNGNSASCTSQVTVVDTNQQVNNPILAVRFFIEGYYSGNGQMSAVLNNTGISSSTTACDSITIILHENTSPFTTVATITAIALTNGWVQAELSPSLIGQSLYLEMAHRNAVTTWSALPVVITQTTSYDFTNAANKAYGDSQRDMADGSFAFYSGDTNDDSVVDFLDQVIVDNDVALFAGGYIPSDLTGDGVVDFLDQVILDNNVSLFIASFQP
jgi:hypothetical protein